MEADLRWWANGSFMLASFPVVVDDIDRGRLREVRHLEGLRETHDLDPAFTLRFDDGSRCFHIGHPTSGRRHNRTRDPDPRRYVIASIDC